MSCHTEDQILAFAIENRDIGEEMLPVTCRKKIQAQEKDYKKGTRDVLANIKIQ